MHDRRNSGKSAILTVIGVTVIILGIVLIGSPAFIPSLAYGPNPPTITWCSINYQSEYTTNFVPVSCHVAPASGSGVQMVVFRYAASTMTPSQANDPSNNWANAHTLQWSNVSLVQAESLQLLSYSWQMVSSNGGINVQNGYYYYYLFNAYSFDGSSNYFPTQTGSILNNWFSVGIPTATPTPTPTSSTPTPTPAPTTVDVTIAVSGSGGFVQWTDSTAGTSGTTSGIYSSAFALNDALSVLAIPASGYQFDHFYITGSLSGSTTNNPFQTGVTSAFTITAYFVQTGSSPSPSSSPTPTFTNPFPTPTPSKSSSPSPSPTYYPNASPSPTPASTYNPFSSPSPAPYTTARSWAIVAVGVALALCGGLLVAVGQAGSSRSRRKP